ERSTKDSFLPSSARIRRIRPIRVPFSSSMSTPTMLHEKVTDQIINAYYAVYNELGYGFLEKVYENALAIELQQRGLVVRQQVPIHVHYQGQIVGEYFADFLIEGCVIIELKAAD